MHVLCFFSRIGNLRVPAARMGMGIRRKLYQHMGICGYGYRYKVVPTCGYGYVWVISIRCKPIATVVQPRRVKRFL